MSRNSGNYASQHSKMKLVIFLIGFVVSSRLTENEEDQLFINYLNQYKIRIGRLENIEKHKKTFIERYYEVEAHNASGNLTYTLEVNAFSHLTYQELNQQKTGYIHPPDELSKDESKPIPSRSSRVRTPEDFDWRNTPKVVRPVQNQATCGSCWAFAAIAAIEGQMAIRKKLYDKLSEQEIIECVTSNGRLLGCNGGSDDAAYDHVRVFKGDTTAAFNPYLGVTAGRCNVRTPRAPGSAIRSRYHLPTKNETYMREILYSNGPLYVILHVSNEFYSYKSGIYQDSRNLCALQEPNHAVLLVGYGIENGIDFWILKNSWGTDWGEKGFVRLQRGRNLCSIDSGASFPELV